MTTLHQMRDKAMHDARRRHGWDKAFTAKSLRSYDNRQLKYADQLVTQIRKRSGEAVNATQWLNYFAFDVMGIDLTTLICALHCADTAAGDLAFGRAFEALEKGESHFYIDLIHGSAKFPGTFGTMPWALQILTLIPHSWTPMGRMLMYSEKCVDERRVGTTCPFLTSLADSRPRNTNPKNPT